MIIDNVTICGRSQEDHDRNLQKFLQTAKGYGITFNHNKSILSKKKITLLGYEIELNSIKPDPERLQPLLNLAAPTNLASQRRVVGMFAYYSRWIRDFSAKIRPMVQNTTFPLPNDVSEKFKQLKTDLKDACLVAVDPFKVLVVETDASDQAIRATLSQGGRPVAFFFRTLKDNELKLHSVEKEAYAIVEALRAWKHYLLRSQFKLITDQKSVAFMFDSKQKGKIKNDKIARWRMELSNYKFDIT